MAKPSLLRKVSPSPGFNSLPTPQRVLLSLSALPTVLPRTPLAGLPKENCSSVSKARSIRWMPTAAIAVPWFMTTLLPSTLFLATTASTFSLDLPFEPPVEAISIWRIDSAGGNLKRITEGPLDTPAMCSPDGQWLVYATLLAGKFVPMKISLASVGPPTQISDSLLTCGCINISPDGKNIAFQTQPATGGPVVIQILDFDTLKPVKTLERDPRAVGEIRYVTDGSAIGYPVRDKGQYALWITPVDGSPGKQITDFATDFITDLHWSTDSSKL